MKKIANLLVCAFLAVTSLASCRDEAVSECSISIQFKDPNFLAALIENNVDADGDGQISFDEAKAVKYLSIENSNIKEMPEIRYFTALTQLYCQSNQLTALDVSNNTALTTLSCYGNSLQTITISGSQINDSWMDDVKNWYPDIEIIVK